MQSADIISSQGMVIGVVGVRILMTDQTLNNTNSTGRECFAPNFLIVCPSGKISRRPS